MINFKKYPQENEFHKKLCEMESVLAVNNLRWTKIDLATATSEITHLSEASFHRSAREI